MTVRVRARAIAVICRFVRVNALFSFSLCVVHIYRFCLYVLWVFLFVLLCGWVWVWLFFVVFGCGLLFLVLGGVFGFCGGCGCGVGRGCGVGVCRRVHRAGSCVCLKTRDLCESENDGVACLP